MRRLVDSLEVERVRLKLDGVHAATDIDADDIWHSFISNGHSGADCATFTGVHVGHNADFAVAREFVIAHAANLFARRILNDFRERNRRIVFASDLFHKNSPYIIKLKDKTKLMLMNT